MVPVTSKEYLHCKILYLPLVYSYLTTPSANPSSEDPTMSWEFFVKHFEDQEKAQKDSKFTWRMTNGSFYVGTSPPEGAEPLGIFYPRTGTLGGCGNHNAMNLALPPDSDWEYIANATGDQSWAASKMLQYFTRIESCQYLPENTAGHGFAGWLGVHTFS